MSDDETRGAQAGALPADTLLSPPPAVFQRTPRKAPRMKLPSQAEPEVVGEPQEDTATAAEGKGEQQQEQQQEEGPKTKEEKKKKKGPTKKRSASKVSGR
jgi:hypothetical protein